MFFIFRQISLLTLTELINLENLSFADDLKEIRKFLISWISQNILSDIWRWSLNNGQTLRTDIFINIIQ